MYDTTAPTILDYSDAPLTTNSRHVADMLGKSHKAILSKIKEIIQIDVGLADNFLPAAYTLSSGVFRVTSFNMTQAGFDFLFCTIGSRGHKTAAIARKFHAAFKHEEDMRRF